MTDKSIQNNQARARLLRLASTSLLFCGLLGASPSTAEPLAVHQPEGATHGFVTVRGMDGKRIGDGEVTVRLAGKNLALHVDLRFLDGSRHDDKVSYAASGHLRLLEDTLIQTGPTFPKQIESSINAESGVVRVAYTDEKGKTETIEEKMETPADIANGLLLTALKHVDPNAPESSISWIAATPKPRLVKLLISPQGKESVTFGTIKAETVHYVVKTKIGGLAGVVAPLIGKQPPDIHVWMLAGGAPGFLKYQGPLYSDGPIWRIEMAAPASD